LDIKKEVYSLCDNLLNLVGVIWIVFWNMLAGSLITAVILVVPGSVVGSVYDVGYEYFAAVAVALGSACGLLFFVRKHAGGV